MAKYLCTHRCLYLGRVTHKGDVIEVADGLLKKPEYAVLKNGHSFEEIEGAAPELPQPTKKEKAERDDLYLRLAALKVAIPQQATLEGLRELLVDATRTDGAPLPNGK